MRQSALHRIAALVSVVALFLDIGAQPVSAQSVMERMKRAAEQAAAAQKAKEKQQPPQQQPAPQQPAQTSSQPKTATAPSDAAGGDCCSPDAIRKIASTVGFVDIVGIKLGMTPEQAFAAVKAFNPQMKIDIRKTRVESPDAPGQFTEVPQYAVAHTVGKSPYPNQPPPFSLPDGSLDVITIEFTIPPSPAFVARVDRETQFPNAQPIIASNLVDALHKKWGQELISEAGLVWVFDAAGKPVTRPLQGPEQFCANAVTSSNTEAPPYIDLSSTRELDSTPRSAVCRGIVFASAFPLGQGTPRNQQVTRMMTAIHSGALTYGSRKAMHDWLQAKGDAKAKQQEDAAKARSAPKL
jgi:hypothetical protein